MVVLSIAFIVACIAFAVIAAVKSNFEVWTDEA